MEEKDLPRETVGDGPADSRSAVAMKDEDVTCIQVADLFAKTYYEVMYQCPESVFRFYASNSVYSLNGKSFKGREVVGDDEHKPIVLAAALDHQVVSHHSSHQSLSLPL